jgi:hypothetical protein
MDKITSVIAFHTMRHKMDTDSTIKCNLAEAHNIQQYSIASFSLEIEDRDRVDWKLA